MKEGEGAHIQWSRSKAERGKPVRKTRRHLFKISAVPYLDRLLTSDPTDHRGYIVKLRGSVSGAETTIDPAQANL